MFLQEKFRRMAKEEIRLRGGKDSTLNAKKFGTFKTYPMRLHFNLNLNITIC